MFSDSSTDVVGFTSCAKGPTLSQNAEAQTEQRAYQDRESQLGSSHNIEVQTDNTGCGVSSGSEVDYDRLAAFLRKVCPKVLEELDKAERSRAFDCYDPAEGDEDDEVKKLYVLLTPQVKARMQVKVGGLAWSCTAGVVAVGYSQPDHENWCDHGGVLHLFNITRPDFSPSAPSRSLETSSCVTSLAAHPSEPSLLAAGTFSGEVLVWNLQSDTGILVGCSSGSHQEAVSQLCWVRSPDPTHRRPLLASAGRDGRIFLWRADPAPGSFCFVDGFVVTLEHGGTRASRAQASPLGGRSCTEVGVTCLSFSPHDPSYFVVGLEGGGLLQCSTLLAKQSPVSSAIPLKDPVLTAFEGHLGTVTCVRHSVHNVSLLLSCGGGEIHLYNVNQVSPVRVIQPATEVLGVEWVGSHPRLFCAWGPTGNLQYHSITPSEGCSGTLVLCEGRDSMPVDTMCFSPRSDHQMVVVGDVHGGIMVWKLPKVKDPSPVNSTVADKKQ